MEAAAIGTRGIRAMTDDDRTDAEAAIFADVEKGRAFRSAYPFVQVAGVVGGAKGVEMQRDHAGRVGAVDERVDPAFVQFIDEPRDGKDQAGLAGDVID